MDALDNDLTMMKRSVARGETLLDAFDNEDSTMMKRLLARKAESLDDLGNNHLTMIKRSFRMGTVIGRSR